MGPSIWDISFSTLSIKRLISTPSLDTIKVRGTKAMTLSIFFGTAIGVTVPDPPSFAYRIKFASLSAITPSCLGSCMARPSTPCSGRVATWRAILSISGASTAPCCQFQILMAPLGRPHCCNGESIILCEVALLMSQEHDYPLCQRGKQRSTDRRSTTLRAWRPSLLCGPLPWGQRQL